METVYALTLGAFSVIAAWDAWRRYLEHARFQRHVLDRIHALEEESALQAKQIEAIAGRQQAIMATTSTRMPRPTIRSS